MAFVKKTWKDRIAEFPTRRRLTKEDNTSELVTVAREEGTLSQEDDAFSAENMNDLENRIDAEFTEVNGKLVTYVYVDVVCEAMTWITVNLPDEIESNSQVVNVCSADILRGFYGCLWWGRDKPKEIIILRINTNGKNLVVDDTAKTIKLRIWYKPK